ncbi:hypothetical protein ACWEF6_10665 [Amycolatopsis sp. NPDC004772]
MIGIAGFTSEFTQAVLLQIGSTILLIAPLVVMQRILTDELMSHSVDEAEDRIAASMISVRDDFLAEKDAANVDPELSAEDVYRDAVRDALVSSFKVDSESDQSRLVIRTPGAGYGRLRVVPRYFKTPIPSMIVQELLDLADMTDDLVVLVTSNRLTNSAEQARRDAPRGQLEVIKWSPEQGGKELIDRVKSLDKRY